MKIRSKAAFFLLVLLAGVALAPQFLRLEQVQSALVVRLERELPIDLELDAIRWHWWPLPRLSMRDVRIEGDRWQLTAPAAEFHPGWRTLLGKRGSTGRIILKKPAFRLSGKGREMPPQEKEPLRLPHLALTVEDGSFFLPADDLPVPFRTDRLEIAGIKGRIDVSPDEISVQAEAASPFLHHLELQGNVRPATGAYRFKIESRGLALHKAIASVAGGRLLPGESVVDLKGEIEGTGFSTLRADLTGEFPCFLIKPQDQSMLITCGLADLSLVKANGNIEIAIRKLDLKDPQLTLQGRLLRKRPQHETENPSWQIDLTARDVDLAEVREKILVLLGDDHTVQEVTGVVRGGTAPALRFEYAGPAAALDRLEAITVEGQLEKTKLKVPKVDLDLYEVRGDFAIRNGTLTGRNLQARLGKSEGRNGEFLLDLTGGRKEFRLDLDLEAEIAELPGVLHKTVHNERFLREVDQFSDLEGRVNGRLHVGDHLRHPVVAVTVDELKGGGRYGRLSWPFRFEGGRLEVASDRRVGWRNVRAAIGPHQVSETTGAVSWQEGLGLDISTMKAILAAEPLHQELTLYPEIRRKLAPALTTLTGTLEITSGTFHGPVRQPEQWQYRLGIKGVDLEWTSPLLGPPVSTRTLSGNISHQEAVVVASDNTFHGQKLVLQGRFKHRQLAHWRGWVEFDGVAGQRLASWVKKKGWVPATFFPRIPCVLEGLRIGWGEGYLSLNGGLVAGTRLQALPRVDFDLRKIGGGVAVERVAITAADEYGLLALDLPGGETAGFELSWRGNLDGRTLDALLESNRLLAGRVAGVCTFRYAPGQPQRTRLVGTLQAGDFRLPLSGPEPLIIERLQLNGDGTSLDLPLLEMDFAGEKARAKGRITTIASGLRLHLDLESPALSWQTLARLQKSMVRKNAGNDGWKSWDLLGRIGFDIAEFRYAPGAESGEEGKTGYRWLPLQGTIDLQPGKPWQIQVNSAQICGLDMSGSWTSGEAAEGLIRIQSDSQAPPAFEEVMPCLGIEQDLILGEFSLDATLHGQPGQWTGGDVSLRSAQGNIRRLTLLSKVFSVVNLTDLFTDMGGSPVAGGLPYSVMSLEAQVADNHLVFKKAVVRGEGLNLFGRGKLDLSAFRTDLTILIAPFKTIDAIISSVPVIGRVIGGENATLVTIPVGVKGPVADPSVIVLAPDAVGESVLTLVKDTISLPFTLLSPIFSGGD